MNVTGSGVTVAVVDDGVQWNHPDLAANYNPKGSFDLNSNDDNPMPMYDENEENKHGTRCAGEIAAVPNNVCGVGVSFGAKFSGIRVLDGPITDSMEATAFNKHLDINDIYSCSWGPEDDAKTLDGPHPLAQAALIHGVTAGRRGFGSIYIVASGNGGNEGDNCNFDGYANSIYTITIGAVDERGDMPYYAEECASMLASTFSSGNPSGRDTRKIVTTDWTMGRSGSGSAGTGCTASHTGTSAATPLAAGMVALMLQVRPCLTWRDVQHIIVYTARHTKGTHKPKNVRSWFTNAAGLQHSAQYGFGLLDAWRLVNAAKVWRTTPMLTSFSPPTIGYNEKIRTNDFLRLHAAVSERDAALHRVITLEHVQVTLTIEHRKRGDIEVSIVCPSGTESLVGPNRAKDTSSLGFKDWTFSTVRCWGESSIGNFYLIVRDRGVIDHGILRYWKLTLYGSSVTPEDVQERRREVEDSYSGEKLDPASNFSIPCPPGESVPFDITEAISDRTLKLLALMSGLFVFWSIYFTIEMAFCNTDEKVLLVYPDEEIDSSDSFVDPTRAPAEHVIANNSK